MRKSETLCPSDMIYSSSKSSGRIMPWNHHRLLSFDATCHRVIVSSSRHASVRAPTMDVRTHKLLSPMTNANHTNQWPTSLFPRSYHLSFSPDDDVDANINQSSFTWLTYRYLGSAISLLTCGAPVTIESKKQSLSRTTSRHHPQLLTTMDPLYPKGWCDFK